MAESCCQRVLREAADALEGTLGVEGFPQDPYEFRRWLRQRADELQPSSNLELELDTHDQTINDYLFEHNGEYPPAEPCRIGHYIYGVCELPYQHAGPHSRIPGGATEANTWEGTTCKCERCAEIYVPVPEEGPQ